MQYFVGLDWAAREHAVRFANAVAEALSRVHIRRTRLYLDEHRELLDADSVPAQRRGDSRRSSAWVQPWGKRKSREAMPTSSASRFLLRT